jgi:hypothetical protein
VVNDFSAVKRSISKVESYQTFAAAGVPTLEFTTDPDEALTWNSGDQGCRILARRDGLSSGRGISIFEPNSVPRGSIAMHNRDADFFAKYFKKTHEYRVHVFLPGMRGRGDQPERMPAGEPSSGALRSSVEQSGVIDITQKKRVVEGAQDIRGGVPGNVVRDLLQKVVRSHANGWVHAHEQIHLPGDFKTELARVATGACAALGLDFGAVDVLARFSTKTPDKLLALAVCEVNTAPGLENQVTIEAWKKAFEGYLNA